MASVTITADPSSVVRFATDLVALANSKGGRTVSVTFDDTTLDISSHNVGGSWA